MTAACALTTVSGLGWAAVLPPMPLTDPLVVPTPPVATPTSPTADAGLGASGDYGLSGTGYGAASLPTTVAAGRTPATFGVTNSGSASYSIPLWTPSGVGDVEFKLALVYNSRGANGVMGQGWSLSGLSAITRCNKTVAQDGVPSAVTNTLSDRFCLDGQQLKLVSGTYGAPGSAYATEIESFSRIVATGAVGQGPVSFTVTTRNGLVYEYGTTSDSQVFAGTSGTIRAWALARIRDRASITDGNSITLSYTNEAQNGAYTNGTYRVASIAYPSTATGQGPFYRVRFSYSARPADDLVVGYLGGSRVRDTNKLDTITIEDYATAATIKSYALSYTQGTATSRLRLASVQECSASACLRPTIIAYQDGQSGWAAVATSLGQAPADPIRVLPIDLNGDGIPDLVYPKVSGGNYNWYVRYATASGTYAAEAFSGVTTSTGAAVVPADFAAKGQTDLLYPSGGYWYRLYWTGSGLSSVPTGTTVGTPQGSSAGATAADVNGDGLPDLVWYRNDFTGGDTTLFVQLNTTVPGGAVTFSATPVAWYSLANDDWTTWSFLSAAGPISYWSMSRSVNIADFNGDGRADILVHLKKAVSNCPANSPTPLAAGDGAAMPEPGGEALAGCGTTYSYFWRALVSTGSSFQQAAGFTQSVEGIRFGFVDWNGDGCTDLYGPLEVGVTFRVYPSLCSAAGAFGTNIDTGIAWTNVVMAGDYDGDGRQDLLSGVSNSGTWKVIRSTGEGIAAIPIDTGVGVGRGVWFVTDLNGDGLIDLGKSDLADGNKLKVHPRTTPNVWPDLATTFADGFGMSQSPTYVSIARGNHTKYADAPFPEADYQGPLYVVSQFTASDGTGSTYQHQFQYYGARVHVQGRGFEGFHAQRIFDTRTNLYTYDYVQRAFPYTGLHTQRSVWLTDGSVRLSEWSGTTDALTAGGGYQQRFFPYIRTLADRRFEAGGALQGTLVTEATTSYTYDAFGNPAQVLKTVTDKDPGSPFLGSSWSTMVDTAYLNDTGYNCLGLPTSQSTTQAVPGQTTRTRTASFSVDASHCRIDQQVLEPSTPALKVTTTLGFDGCGNVDSVQVVGANSDGSAMPARTTAFGYGTRCQFPETVTNALGQVTSLAYDYHFGVPSSSTDPNGLVTTWQYDDFGRRTLEIRPDQTRTAWAFESCAIGPCWGVTDLRFLVYETPQETNGTPILQRQLFYDGFDRLRYDERERVLGVWTQEVFAYDSLGRRIAQHQPYSLGGNGYRTWSYDALDRVTAERLYQSGGALDRTTTVAYAGRTTSITDPLGHTRSQVHDVMGRLRRVVDPSPGGTTRYDYDAFGNLNRIEDAIGAVSTGDHNLRGFRTQWADADRGTWGFAGNSLNELASWSNAKGQSFATSHDKLGRRTSRTEPEGTSTWIWGTSATAHNIGRLASVSGLGYAESHTYDNSGRISRRVVTTDQSYQYDYTYNSLGALDTVTYPTSPVPSGQSGSRFKVQYGYSYGEPVSITDLTQPGGTPLWTLGTANDYGSPTSETLGADVVSRVTDYKAWTNELVSVQSGAGGSATNRQNFAYQWDTADNLTQRQDLTQGLTESFGYDALDRLTSTTGNAVPNLTVAYDASGNVLSKSDVGSYSYHATRKHAVTAAGPNSYAYDANGNVITRNGLSQSWASFDLPTVLTDGTFQSQLWYGPAHQRWKQVGTYTNGTETTHYVGGLLDKVAATSTGLTYWRHYVPTPGGATIVVSRNSDHSATTSFLLTDHLGSSDALLDGTGAYRTRLSFDAFGRRRGSNWNANTAPDWATIGNTSRDGYGGHEMLDNVGLVHMNGRVQDPALGRFLSVDPLIGDLADSQAVNPYAYVGNRPLSFIDPSGYAFVYMLDGPCGGICGTIIASAVSTALSFLSGGSKPPPPPAIALPGQSAQNGAGLCGPGTISPTCGGAVLYEGASPATPDAAYLPVRVIAIDVVVSFIPVAGTVKGVYDAYIVFQDPDSTDVDRVVAVVGALPGGKAIKDGRAIFRIIEEAGRVTHGIHEAADLAKAARGGTYVLRDAAGVVRKTGRTDDLVRRERELGRKHPDKTFEVDKRTDSHPAQRGREQILHDANPSAHSSNGGLDRINGISPKNPKRDEYLEAGRNLP